jgi:arylsulfatase A-like enzyme
MSEEVPKLKWSAVGWWFGASMFFVGVDLALALAYGYRFRLDVPFLLGVATGTDLVVGLLCGLPALAALRWRGAGWLGFATSLVPLAWVVFRSPSWLGVGPLVLGLGAVALAAWDHRERRDRSGLLPVVLGGSALLAGLVATSSLRVVGGDGIVAARPGTAEARPNVLLVVLDTTRADRLGLYGYARPVSPFLDRYAAQATVFEHASSSSSWTLPGHATLFTGIYAPAHGADFSTAKGEGLTIRGRGAFGDFAEPLPESALTLAEILKGQGYETGAVCANAAFLYRGFGLSQGFDSYVDAFPQAYERPLGLRFAELASAEVHRRVEVNWTPYYLASEVNGFVKDWVIDRGDRPKFLFVNYMESHGPNWPQGEYARLFPSSGELELDLVQRRSIRMGQAPLTAHDVEVLIDTYDAESRLRDDQMGELFAWLESTGFLDNAIVIITADHGESIGEHGLTDHYQSLYETETRIPMVIKAKGQTQGQRIGGHVHLIDVLPTILDGVGVPAPAGLPGRSLLAGSGDDPPHLLSLKRPDQLIRTLGDRPDHRQIGVVWRGYKLVRYADGSEHLYDLKADPNELHDLAGEDPARVAEWSARLTELETRWPAPAAGVGEDQEALRQRLEALGYVE